MEKICFQLCPAKTRMAPRIHISVDRETVAGENPSSEEGGKSVQEKEQKLVDQK